MSLCLNIPRYLLDLIEKLEVGLADSSEPTLVQDTLRGTVVQQMMCQGGCKTVKEREESFYSVALEVGGEGVRRFVLGRRCTPWGA